MASRKFRKQAKSRAKTQRRKTTRTRRQTRRTSRRSTRKTRRTRSSPGRGRAASGRGRGSSGTAQASSTRAGTSFVPAFFPQPVAAFAPPVRMPENSFGIANLGNSCYFNAVWQIIFHMFATFNNFQAFAGFVPRTQCQEFFLALFQSSVQTLQQNQSVWKPNDAIQKNFIQCFFTANNRQEDAEELFVFVAELLQSMNIPAVTQLFMQQQAESKICKQNDRIEKVFDQVFLQPVFRMSALLGNSVQEVYNAMTVFQRDPGTDTRCAAFPNFLSFTKSAIVGHGQFVMLQIDRQRLDGTKFTKPLDLNNFVLQLEGGDTFNLVGAIFHSGAVGQCGHYYAYRKIGADWFSFNDTNVTRVANPTLDLQNANLLLYKLR